MLLTLSVSQAVLGLEFLDVHVSMCDVIPKVGLAVFVQDIGLVGFGVGEVRIFEFS